MVTGEQLETVDWFESSTLESPFLEDPIHSREFYFQEPPTSESQRKIPFCFSHEEGKTYF